MGMAAVTTTKRSTKVKMPGLLVVIQIGQLLDLVAGMNLLYISTW
jgi:hypothetical protein